MSALSEVCIMLGCSGMNARCPGNPLCSILVNAVDHPAFAHMKPLSPTNDHEDTDHDHDQDHDPTHGARRLPHR